MKLIPIKKPVLTLWLTFNSNEMFAQFYFASSVSTFALFFQKTKLVLFLPAS